ncbi:glucosidase [soil metagenome]
MNVGKHEVERLELAHQGKEPWKKWGPYLSERQWGTVREDYSQDGDAWSYFSHDHSRSRAYRWGEDGLAGISDDHQVLCFSLALWNEHDPILKERLFGLTNSEGNHGEDVKEYYFYLDSTPSHSYMKYLYKYPQQAFPYSQLIDNNRGRSRQEPEYELLDTKIFDENRYFDVFVEYAKAGPKDILVRITAENRGKDDAPLHLLPTLLFRNTWSHGEHSQKPVLEQLSHAKYTVVHAHHTDPLFQESLADYYLYCDSLDEVETPLLFCDNDTNHEKLFGMPNTAPFVKDGINNLVVNGMTNTCNPEKVGTKASAHYQMMVPGLGSKTVMLRLSNIAPDIIEDPFAKAEEIFAQRIVEANHFYEAIYTPEMIEDGEKAKVFRQAMAGMLWSKQYFYYDLERWLKEHKGYSKVRNADWQHMFNDDVISMPDKWEYPWYAAWDLAFHTVPLGTVDTEFAKQQLDLMLRNDYQHPNGQLPAYEWNFSDVNPPVHAFATIEIYLADKERNNGKGDIDFLKYAFTKLIVNYSWWINRKDPAGKNVFEGGFLGLDNIGVFDRSKPLPTGGSLEQADGTSWMVFFSQQMLKIAIEVASFDSLYEDLAVRFLQHTLWIAGAMDRIGDHRDELWDEEDGFFYDVLRLPNSKSRRLKVRSMVGLLPLTAVSVIEEKLLHQLPTFKAKSKEFTQRHPELCANMHLPSKPGVNGRRMLSVVNQAKLRRILARMLDEKEFLSPYGIRSLSLYHKDHPFVLEHEGHVFRVDYLPGESDNGMFGGNSNWRGPIWMPVNYLLVKSLYQYYSYYGDDFKVECPTGSGKLMTLLEIAHEISRRLYSIFLPGPDGKRPVYGNSEKFQSDPHFSEHVLFYEYFHAETGAGLGASHQTGWTGLVARLMRLEHITTAELLLSQSASQKARQALMAHWNDND